MFFWQKKSDECVAEEGDNVDHFDAIVFDAYNPSSKAAQKTIEKIYRGALAGTWSDKPPTLP